MCDRVVSEDPFLLVDYPNKYRTQKMCDEVVDDSLAPDYFVTSKMIKILFAGWYADENKLYFNEDAGNVLFICIEMGILNIDLNIINLGNTNYEEDDPDTIILIRILT